MLQKTWIVVADNMSAHFHSMWAREVTPDVAGPLRHLEGRLRSKDLVTDRPGVSRDDASSRPRSYGERTSPAAHERERFAQEIARAIESAFTAGHFTALTLVMPPKLLGLVRADLSERVRAAVVGEIAGRLSDRPLAEVVERLNAVRKPAPLV